MRFAIDAVFLGSPDPGRDGARPVRLRPSRAAGVDRARAAGAGRARGAGTPRRHDRAERDRGRATSCPGAGRRARVSAGRARAGHHRSMAALRRLDRSCARSRLPGGLFRLRSRGTSRCARRACRRSMRGLRLPGGTPIGLPAELPAPLLQLEWCAPFAGPVRAALHDLKYAGERRLAEPARGGDRRGAGRGSGRGAERRRPGARPCRSASGGAATTRRRSSPRSPASGSACRIVRALERRRATIAQFELGRDERAANVAGAFRSARRGAGARAPSRAAGSCSSTTWSRPARRWRPAPIALGAPEPWRSRRSPSPASAESGRTGRRGVYSEPDGSRPDRAHRTAHPSTGPTPGGSA